MGKAKQEASARADELLKSYNVKLNPMAGTYRLVDKATGKETNVERSGVDVGTSWLASGRRANRLIGKNLVRRGSSYDMPVATPTPTPPKQPDNTKQSATTSTTVESNKQTEPKNTFGVKFGELNTAPRYQFPSLVSSKFTTPFRYGSQSIKQETTVKQQEAPAENNQIGKLPQSSYRPAEEYPEQFGPGFGKYAAGLENSGFRDTKLIPKTSAEVPATATPSSSNLQAYHKFRFDMLSKPIKNFYKTPEAYGKTLPHTEESYEVVNYAKQKAAQDIHDAQPTNWERMQKYFGGLNTGSTEAILQAKQLTGGRSR